MSDIESMTTNSVGSTGSSTNTSGGATKSSKLNTDDFIHMMMTQLQHQDPLNPTTSDQLMSQMSQIGQLQSTSQLQTTLTGLATQTSIGAASSLMGKKVTGIDLNKNPVSGLVSAVQVSSTGVNLQLKDGSTMALSNVSAIEEPAEATGA